MSIKIFVINLLRYSERKIYMQEQLEKLNADLFEYYFFQAVDAKNNEHIEFKQKYRDFHTKLIRGKSLTESEIACFASHYYLWKKCVTLNEPIIILEDDVELQKNFEDSIKDIMNVGYEYVKLAKTFDKKLELIKGNFYISFYDIAGTQGYFLTPSAAYKFITVAKKIHKPVDDYMDSYWRHNVWTIVYEPNLLKSNIEFDSTMVRPKARNYFFKLTREIRTMLIPLVKNYYLFRRSTIINNLKFSLVSVIITNYNYGRYIIEAIESIINQTYKNWELIIVDDNSTDNSQQIIYDYIKKHNDYIKIQFIKNETNLGSAGTRNNGLKQAIGEYVVFLDADDYVRDDFLERYVKQIQNDNADIVYCSMQSFGSDNGFAKMPHPNRYKNIYYANQLICCSMFRREAALKVGGYNTNQKAYVDWELWVRLHSNGYTRATKVNAVLFFYRKHGNSLYEKGKDIDEILKAQIIINNRNHYNKYYVMWAEAILNNNIDIVQHIKTKLGNMPNIKTLKKYFG